LRSSAGFRRAPDATSRKWKAISREASSKSTRGILTRDGSPEAEQFAEGQRAAVLTAQDAEE
jgi:hypothetical protein